MNEANFMAVKYAETPLPQKPRLVPWVTLVDLGEERLQFRAPQFVYTLQTDLFINVFELIRPLLNGNHSVEEITSAGETTYLPTTILFLLKILRANGLLQEGNISSDPPLSLDETSQNNRILGFLSHFVLDSQGVLASLQKAKIGLVGSTKLKAYIQNSIKDLGIKEIKDLDPLFICQEKLESKKKGDVKVLNGLDLLVACQESEGFGFFEAVNELCLETCTRWLHVAIEGASVVLGPTFVPFQTACYACYDRRLTSNLPDFDDYEAYKKRVNFDNKKIDVEYFPPLWSLASSHVTIEMARIVSGFAPPKTMGRCYFFEEMSPNAVGHDVLRLPRCPACHPRRPKNQAWDQSPSSK